MQAFGGEHKQHNVVDVPPTENRLRYDTVREKLRWMAVTSWKEKR